MLARIREWDRPALAEYSPECVEGEFSELRVEEVLRSSDTGPRGFDAEVAYVAHPGDAARATASPQSCVAERATGPIRNREVRARSRE